MPLNEDEQRILSQIERSFYDNDPEIAEKIAKTTVYKASGKRVKLAVAVFLAGFVFMVAFYSVNTWLGVLGFCVMLTASFEFVSEARKMGRAGIADLEQTLRVRAQDAERKRHLRGRNHREE